MALDLSVRCPTSRKGEPRILVPVLPMCPLPPPPSPPTPGMYLPGPPSHPGPLAPCPIIVRLYPMVAVQMDAYRSISLIQYISNAGVVPSQEDDKRRERVLYELDKIVMDWAQKVAYDMREQYWNTSATVLTFGSYDLGAHGPESDIDAVCIGPCIASLQYHFFVSLRQMLEERVEVSDLHSIESAKVPLMRFKFNGILVDFTYAQLPVINAAEEKECCWGFRFIGMHIVSCIV